MSTSKPLKHQYPITSLYGVTAYKTQLESFTATKTSNLALQDQPTKHE